MLHWNTEIDPWKAMVQGTRGICGNKYTNYNNQSQILSGGECRGKEIKIYLIFINVKMKM